MHFFFYGKQTLKSNGNQKPHSNVAMIKDRKSSLNTIAAQTVKRSITIFMNVFQNVNYRHPYNLYLPRKK